jgi:site-specific DNA-methyltransferase (adenine-specific)
MVPVLRCGERVKMSLPKPYYQDDYCTIYNADCREILPFLDPYDLVLTDPPYGVTQNGWDTFSTTIEVFDEIKTPIVCTCQNPATSELIVRYKNRFKWSDVWEKTQAVGFLNCKIMPMRQHEDIIVFASGKMPFYPQISKKNKLNIRPHSDTSMSTNYGKFKAERNRSIAADETYPRSIVTFSNSQEGMHPTQKPLKLFSYLILSFTLPSQTILDPFMGSGTTLRAAKDLNRKAIGIEIEEKYCEIAVDRLRQEVLELK